MGTGLVLSNEELCNVPCYLYCDCGKFLLAYLLVTTHSRSVQFVTVTVTDSVNHLIKSRVKMTWHMQIICNAHAQFIYKDHTLLQAGLP